MTLPALNVASFESKAQVLHRLVSAILGVCCHEVNIASGESKLRQ